MQVKNLPQDPEKVKGMTKDKINTTFFRCPKGHQFMTLEMCAARKKRKHYGCVSCRVPAQKRREYRQRVKANNGGNKK